MTIFIFGNPDFKEDSLPLKILPGLKKKFPEIVFLVKDPNEDFELPEDTVIIDVVAGLKEPHIFNSLDDFQTPPRLTLHDFDLFSHLQFLKKIGKLPGKLKIIGLPPQINPQKAIKYITNYCKIFI